MRAAESYRPARRNLARALRLPWADLPRKNSSTGALEVIVPKQKERLVGCAILRNRQVMHIAQGSHAQLRGYKNPEPGDIEGYFTASGMFVDRAAALNIAVHAGQISKDWIGSGRKLLSSDINWDGTHGK